MTHHDITLSTEELEEIKDDIKFRTRVLIQLKSLSGIPIKVTKLEVHSTVHWALFVIILGSLISIFLLI